MGLFKKKELYVGFITENTFKLLPAKTERGFLRFKDGEEEYIAIITTKAFFYPDKKTDVYFVRKGEQNTLNPEDLSILDEEIREQFIKHLEANPDKMYYTTQFEDIKKATDVAIIKDTIIQLLDQNIIFNFLTGAFKKDMFAYIMTFIAGMGFSLVLLMILGVVNPDNVLIRIGGV